MLLSRRDLLFTASASALAVGLGIVISRRLVGLVCYADDPDKKVFRVVHPNYAQGETDAVLDDPQWVTFGCDPSRRAIMRKVLAGSAEASAPMTGMP